MSGAGVSAAGGDTVALCGKGFYIWQIPHCERGDPGAIAARAVAAGLSHVLIKIADGAEWRYNYNYDAGVDLVPPVKQALTEAGIKVWGWHYVRGDDPLGEAQLAVQRTSALGMDGYVIDAEVQYKNLEKWDAASQYMQELRRGLPDIPMALSTYRYPYRHRYLPFSIFLEGCDYAMPQVYFEEAHNPEEQLEMCIGQYQDLTPARPVIPTAPTYATSVWRPTADEITRFFTKARDMGLTAANAWSWDYSRQAEYVDLWNAVADFDWPPIPPSEEMPDQLVERLNQHDPVQIVELYHNQAAHVTGARTVVGRDGISAWYRTMLQQLLPDGRFELTGKSGDENSRHFTWTATSLNGSVADGSDTLGMRSGKIQYHYSYFTIT
ncbi:MAG: nuclear transport factor 2 family protein [Anaerolineales bacterium]|jgi:hypothetical protein